MKSYLVGLTVLSSFLIYSGSSYSCGANHGYTKMAAAISQSALTSERKDELAQLLSESQVDHDSYTASGDYEKMSEAVQKLVRINRELNK